MLTIALHLQTLGLYPYSIPMVFGEARAGVIIHLKDAYGNQGWGEIAPLPRFSKESLAECLPQLHTKTPEIVALTWTLDNLFENLAELALLPAVTFGLESALLMILSPLSEVQVSSAALLMGTPEKILEMAKQRQAEGFTLAKLKVGHLSFDTAALLIERLKDTFQLRIDVNRAWSLEEALRFFAQFPKELFDYVEEPCNNPKELAYFTHPLAVDESYPDDLSLEQLEKLPTLKAVIYKPTIQGGLLGCRPLKQWADTKGVQLVLSSSFESNIGLFHIASLAHRLSLKTPIGIGTAPYMLSSLPFTHDCNFVKTIK